MTTEARNTREYLIFGKPYTPERYLCGGIARFDRMSVATADKLIELGFLDPGECQEDGPTAEEFINFCKRDESNWYLHGFAISPERKDCCVVIEGIGSLNTLSAEETIDFVTKFRFADTLFFGAGEKAYCWYD